MAHRHRGEAHGGPAPAPAPAPSSVPARPVARVRVRAFARAPVPAAVAAVAAVACLALGGCGTDETDTRSEVAGLPSTRDDVEAHEWVLVPAAGRPGVPDDVEVTFAVRGDVVSGRAPCNAYRAEVTMDEGDDTLEVGEPVRTGLGCDRPVMRAEDDYLAALRSVTTAEVDDGEDRLTLRGDGVHLVFDAFDADEALPGAWQVVGLTPGEGDSGGSDGTGDAGEGDAGEGDGAGGVGVLDGTGPAIAFVADSEAATSGDLVMDTGCRVVAGTWELDGDDLTVTPTEPTAGCEGPAGLVARDAALVRALERAARAEVGPTTLAVLDDEGEVALLAVAIDTTTTTEEQR